MAKRRIRRSLGKKYRALMLITSIIMVLVIVIYAIVSSTHSDILGTWENDSGYTVTFKSFGKVIYFGDMGKYEIERDKIKITPDKAEEGFLVEYSIEDDKLYISDSSGTQVFNKIN